MKVLSQVDSKSYQFDHLRFITHQVWSDLIFNFDIDFINFRFIFDMRNAKQIQKTMQLHSPIQYLNFYGDNYFWLRKWCQIWISHTQNYHGCHIITVSTQLNWDFLVVSSYKVRGQLLIEHWFFISLIFCYRECSRADSPQYNTISPLFLNFDAFYPALVFQKWYGCFGLVRDWVIYFWLPDKTLCLWNKQITKSVTKSFVNVRASAFIHGM